jgi:hypothetical protein
VTAGQYTQPSVSHGPHHQNSIGIFVSTLFYLMNGLLSISVSSRHQALSAASASSFRVTFAVIQL